MTGYEFHPEAETDLNDIWDYIASDSVNAADRVIAEIHQTLEGLVPFPYRGHTRRDIKRTRGIVANPGGPSAYPSLEAGSPGDVVTAWSLKTARRAETARRRRLRARILMSGLI